MWKGGGIESAKDGYDGGYPREVVGLESSWQHDMGTAIGQSRKFFSSRKSTFPS